MSLTKEQLMERNLNLAETHLLRILERPDLLANIPDDAHVIFLPAEDRELLKANLATANRLVQKMSHNGPPEPVVLVLLPVEDKELMRV